MSIDLSLYAPQYFSIRGISRDVIIQSDKLFVYTSLRDIAGIEEYSIEQFGKRVADRYIDKLEGGIKRIATEPGLLWEEPMLHDTLRFYRVEKHLLACETGIEGRTIVLAVIHASMDIPTRLSELEPKIALEVEFLLKELKRSSKS